MPGPLLSRNPKAQRPIGPTDGKGLARAFYDIVWNHRQVEEATRFLSDDVVLHAGFGGKDLRGLGAYVDFARAYLAAVPDYHIDLHEVLQDEDLVAFRWTCTGTHRGTLFAVPATGRRFTLTGMTIYRIRDGKFVEGWAERDLHALMKQLGA